MVPGTTIGIGEKSPPVIRALIGRKGEDGWEGYPWVVN